LLTSGYYRDRIFNEYTEGRLGGSVNVAHMFTKEWSAGVGIRAERITVSNVGGSAFLGLTGLNSPNLNGIGPPEDYLSVRGVNQLYAPRLTVLYDVRDSMVRPTEGGKIETSFEMAFGSFTFPILNIEASRYFTTWQRPDGSGKHVIALRTLVGFEGENTPVYERYFGGGYTNLRGFQFRGVGPNVNGFMVGGTFQFLNRIEYQVPIRANDALYAVAFLDSGTVESKIGITNYRVSAGFGFRISLPMLGPVPLALDFGFPINRAPGDITQLFSFGMGIYP
jgi:outer membrane protein insertion porin family